MIYLPNPKWILFPLMKTTPGLCLQVILTDSLAVLTKILWMINIFSNNSRYIYNSGSVRNYVDSFKTVIGDFNFSKIIFLKMPLYVAFPFHAFRKNGKFFFYFIMAAVFFSVVTIIFWLIFSVSLLKKILMK